MSFPKAKLHRFNEEMTCAPPPGKYDPKFDNKVKGAVIQKSKRFVDSKLNLAASTESLDSVSCSTSKSASTTNLQPVFRTPQLTRRKVLTTPKSVSSINLASTSGKTKRALNNEFKNETHLEKLVSDLNAELKEKKNEIEDLYKELAMMKKNEVDEQSKIDEERKILEKQHLEEIDQLKAEIEVLQKKIDKEREQHINELDKLSDETVITIDSMKVDIENKLKNFESDLDVSQMEMQIDFQTKLEEVTKEIREQSDDLERKTLQTISKVQMMQIDFEKQTEQFKEYLEESDQKLANTVKELTALSIEKEELKTKNHEQKMIIDKTNKALGDAEKRYKKIDSELARSRQKCKNFQVATMEHRKTIEALSTRLYESESEVERLNSVQTDLEEQKKLLEAKADSLVLEIISLRESMQSMESEIIRDVEDIKNQLTSKVDTYRMKAAEETKSLLETVHDKQRTIDMLLLEVDYYRKRLTETDDFAGNLKEKSELQCTEILDLRKKLTETEDEFADRINAQRNVYSILDENFKEKCDFIYKLEQIKYHQEQQINELITKLDHQSECAQRATSQIAALTTQNAEHEKRIENLVNKLETSGEYVQTFTKHIEDIAEQMSKKEEKITALHQDIETKQAELMLISVENSEFKQKLEDQNLRIEELEKEIRDTHRDNEKYVDELISEIVLEKERCSELSCVMAQLEEEKSNLEERIKKSLHENEEISLDCTKLREDANHYAEVAQSESEERAMLARLLADNQQEQVRQQNQRDAESVEKAQLIVELSTKIDNLEDLVKAAEESKNSLEIDNESLRSRLESLNKYLETVESDKMTLEEKADKLDKEIADLLRTNKEQLETIESLNDEISVYKAKEIDLEEVNAAVASLKDEIVVLCDTLETKDKTIDQLCESKTTAMQDLEELEKEAKAYEEKLSVLSRNLEVEKRNHSELLQSYTKMENRKNEYKLYSGKLTEEYERQKKELKMLEDENERLLKEKHDLEVNAGPFLKQLKEFEEERKTLSNKNDAMEEEILALERNHAKTLGHQNLKQKIHYVSTLKEENLKQKQMIEQLQAE
ncbi:hyaluronan mediated motility receptor [Nilaparvata lugens]|uniref:hyaluronan mediated motility receptor n=1 Tax=Nilaparvata lugens TaxID=108931 RepID=UPI00193D41ED|nr:hyaluronan mediated motility receptor [Nilaparvata lugens]